MRWEYLWFYQVLTINLNTVLKTSMRTMQRSVQDYRKRWHVRHFWTPYRGWTLQLLQPSPTPLTISRNYLLWTTFIAITHIHSKTSFTSNHKVQLPRLLKICQNYCPSFLFPLNVMVFKKVWSPNHSAILS